MNLKSKHKPRIKFFVIIKDKSERLKNKNFLKLDKIKLYKHLLYEIHKHDVYIDTDSNNIIKECKKDKKLKNITIYKRNKKFIDLENSKKYKISPVYLLIENFLKKYCKNDDIIVTTHVTSPFIKIKTINKAIEFLNLGFKSVSSVTRHQEFGLLKNKNKYININFDNNIVNKTQDLNPIILLNGSFFIFTKKNFIKYKSRYSNKHHYFEINYPESIDINYEEDFITAQHYVKSKI